MKRIFIGGAWPYANNNLHIGHLAALLPGDIIARFYRQKGDEVIYVSGTDCHGTPITERAKAEQVNPAEIVDRFHSDFSLCFESLNFTYDLYTKTCDEYHKNLVKEYFTQIKNNGYIYEKEEEQDYCPNCEKFLSDREIEGVCPNCNEKAKGDQCDFCLTTFNTSELKDKYCRECNGSTIQKGNRHLYFALSKFQSEIQELIDSSQERWRLQAIKESLKYLKNGLVDRATTRQLTWGVETPVAGYEDKKIYVWIEAVLGYLTAGKRVAENNGVDFDKFIKNDEDILTYYVHGKDNIPFHTIIFPALLLALKSNIKLPDYIISSQYVNMEDEKISKSKGNGITVSDLIAKYNSDTIRYYMIANGPERKDVNFSEKTLINMHNKNLVGEYGNFINRNLAFLVKKFDGIVPSGEMNHEIQVAIENAYVNVDECIVRGNLRNALELIFELVKLANKYYDEQKPWIQVKKDIIAFNNTTYTCINLMANLANILQPFIPNSSCQLKEMLGITGNDWKPISVPQCIKLNKINILFERIDDDKSIGTKTFKSK